MATANITWTPCGASSDNQYVYYGKTTIATGTPISGTGWTLYGGVPLANTANSVIINGLDDNVEYTFYVYCHCPSAGNGPLSMQGPIIKYVCPMLSNVSPTYNGISYSLTVPTSANNAGSWIQTIQVSVYDSSNLTKLATNTYTAPFSNTTGNFSALSSSTNYNLQISYSNSAGTKSNLCGSTPFTTAAACAGPTITVNNATFNTFDVNWTPADGGTFDILVNSSVVATGLTVSPYTVTNLNPATIYQVNVRKNCTTGGTGMSQTQNITTANAAINGIVSYNLSDNGTIYLIFSFPSATTFPLTLYCGDIYNGFVAGVPNQPIARGYDIFQIPPGTTPTTLQCPNKPFILNIPQGITTFTSPVPNYNNGCSTSTDWQLSIAGANPQTPKVLYIKINSPSGYNSNFTIANGINQHTGTAISGVLLNNV